MTHPSPAAAPASQVTQIAPSAYIGVAGCIALGVGAALPWLSAAGAEATGTDIPIAFLIDQTDPQLEVGWVLVAVALAGLLVALLSGGRVLARALSTAGGLAVLAVGTFVTRVSQEFQGVSLLDVTSYGLWAAGLGALMMLGAAATLRR